MVSFLLFFVRVERCSTYHIIDSQDMATTTTYAVPSTAPTLLLLQRRPKGNSGRSSRAGRKDQTFALLLGLCRGGRGLSLERSEELFQRCAGGIVGARVFKAL